MQVYNMKNPAVKRLMKEAEELRNPTEEYHAQPIEENLFEWHFTVRGPPNTDFNAGIYHGRITLPPDYPMKPPSIILLTPNGRFEVNKKICLSISGHHPESWQPSWSIRTALLAIIGFMPTHGNGAIGSLDYSPDERQQLALRSQNWECSECGCIRGLLERQDILIENSHKLGTLDSNDINEISSLPEDERNSEDHNCELSNSKTISENTYQNSENTVNIQQSSNAFARLEAIDSEQCTSRHRGSAIDDIDSTNVVTPAETNVSTSRNSSRASDCWSLILIWVIVLVLAFLFFRRLLYQ